MQLHNQFYKLVALGLGTCYIFQVFLNIGGVIKFIPSTGVTLPLVSYGGSSLLSTLIMFAIIQGLYIVREDEEESIERKKKNNSYELRKEELRQQKKQERSQMSRKERKEQSKLEKKEKKKKREVNKEFARVTYVFVALFLVLMGYIGYFNVLESKDIINSPYNPRLDSMADRVVRGKILDKDGNVLAQTETAEDGSEYRSYPYGNLYAHVVGYSSQGKSGLESTRNFELLTSNAFFLEKLSNEFQIRKIQETT